MKPLGPCNQSRGPSLLVKPQTFYKVAQVETQLESGTPNPPVFYALPSHHPLSFLSGGRAERGICFACAAPFAPMPPIRPIMSQTFHDHTANPTTPLRHRLAPHPQQRSLHRTISPHPR